MGGAVVRDAREHRGEVGEVRRVRLERLDPRERGDAARVAPIPRELGLEPREPLGGGLPRGGRRPDGRRACGEEQRGGEGGEGGHHEGRAAYSARASATTTTERAPARRSARAAASAVAPGRDDVVHEDHVAGGDRGGRGERPGDVAGTLVAGAADLGRRLAGPGERAARPASPDARGAGEPVGEERRLVVPARDPAPARERHRDDQRAVREGSPRGEPGAERPGERGASSVLERVDGVRERPAEQPPRPHRVERGRRGEAPAAERVGTGGRAARAAGRERVDRLGADRAERPRVRPLAARGAARRVHEVEERAGHGAGEVAGAHGHLVTSPSPFISFGCGRPIT